MTASNPKKVYKQLKVKPSKLEKFKKHNISKKRSCGRNLKICSRCGRRRGHINKYGLDLCRQCFRDVATKIGFKKYS